MLKHTTPTIIDVYGNAYMLTGVDADGIEYIVTPSRYKLGDLCLAICKDEDARHYLYVDGLWMDELESGDTSESTQRTARRCSAIVRAISDMLVDRLPCERLDEAENIIRMAQPH